MFAFKFKATILVIVLMIGYVKSNKRSYDYSKKENLVEDFPEKELPEKNVYDFVVIGSGSAGSVVASRLSENPKWKVLLLEAGKRENMISGVPLFAAAMQCTPYNWGYLMEYDPGFARGMRDQRLPWPRGKALGGSTVINYMIYTRGSTRDYEKWASLGCPNWSYDKVLPYYMKSENSTLQFRDKRYHGKGGYWSVTNVYHSPLADAFVKGGREMGYNFVDNSVPEQLGFGYIEANVKDGRRHSVASAFLQPVKSRKNLHVRTSALVTKILIRERDKVAYGVEYTRKNNTYRIYVRKEVILSAGTMASPQLLMVSGVGPKTQLDKFDIPTIVDLPVGRNLQDHIAYPGLNFLVNETVSLCLETVLTQKSIANYLANGTGPFTALGGVEALAYIKTEVDTEPDPHHADIELLFVDGGISSDYGVIHRRAMGFRDEVYDKLWSSLHGLPTWTIFPMLMHPKSVGYLELQSSDIRIPPKFYGNYLSHPDDVKTMIAAIRFIQRLAKTPAFQRYSSTEHPTPVPGCEQHTYDSDLYWDCALRTLGISIWHQTGTCRMGAPTDARTVVDDHLRVLGVRGLRVIDTSVIPESITAHTSAPGVMIGEKGADLVKWAWGGRVRGVVGSREEVWKG